MSGFTARTSLSSKAAKSTSSQKQLRQSNDCERSALPDNSPPRSPTSSVLPKRFRRFGTAFMLIALLLVCLVTNVKSWRPKAGRIALTKFEGCKQKNRVKILSKNADGTWRVLVLNNSNMGKRNVEPSQLIKPNKRKTGKRSRKQFKALDLNKVLGKDAKRSEHSAKRAEEHSAKRSEKSVCKKIKTKDELEKELAAAQTQLNKWYTFYENYPENKEENKKSDRSSFLSAPWFSDLHLYARKRHINATLTARLNTKGEDYKMLRAEKQLEVNLRGKIADLKRQLVF